MFPGRPLVTTPQLFSCRSCHFRAWAGGGQELEGWTSSEASLLERTTGETPLHPEEISST